MSGMGQVEPTSVPVAQWLREMRDFAAQSEFVYHSLESDEERRRYSTAALAGMLERLERMHEMKGVGTLQWVRDHLDFMDDLHRGRDHPWRSLGPFGGLQQYTSAEQRFRVDLLVCLEILIDAVGGGRGSKKEAFAILHDATSSRSLGLSLSRIRGLYFEFQRGAFPHPELVATFTQSYWHNNPPSAGFARCEHGDPVHQCRASDNGRCRDIRGLAILRINELLDQFR